MKMQKVFAVAYCALSVLPIPNKHKKFAALSLARSLYSLLK